MEAIPLPSQILNRRHFFVINDHHRESECLRTRLALQPFLKEHLAYMTTLPSLPHTLGAAWGVSYVVFIALSMQETATRYYLFADFNPRGDFQFSVLIHAVAKIFHIGDVQPGFGVFFLWFSFKHMCLVPIQ